MLVKQWFAEKMMARTVLALAVNGFDARSFTDPKELIAEVMKYAEQNARVGIGGSVTVRSIGLMEELAKSPIHILDHWKAGLTKDEMDIVRLQQLTCDLFLSSSNAITEQGDIVNIDGFGNRVSSIAFGPKKVIIIAGYNKIVPDIAAALDRIKRVAAPMNAKRLNLPLPCAETGRCHDCTSEARICRVTSIIQRKPTGTDVSVFLINKELGL
ncbi:MAG: hypothetical protein A4E62_00922 [Syntrophorhabdus sp. PtaU1.Bin002]|nr:MAG: hypothetical protein A4E58_00098 [Syntrophorhabdus sp. PtaB.Bin006]OPY72317.1 MAG: hypothetical protein A4E62_00922 [Syntrophorhabdus sp. PtaU1.Bin002]